MRIFAVFAVLAAVTVLLYAFSFLLSVARSIAIYGLQDSYRQVYDMLNIDAVIAGIYVAAGLLVATSIYLFVKWIGEILSS